MAESLRQRLAGQPLVVATHNPGKLREMAALLAPYGLTLVSAAERGLPEPVEDGRSFAENAAIKAQAAAASGLPALADDSGLEVAALGGQPGIHSARWAGPEKDFAAAMARIEAALAGQPDRSARFTCLLCLALPDGETRFFEGWVEGRLVWPPRGAGGFGYDPLFQPAGEALTFGEMPQTQKQAMSHRARAFAKLVEALQAPPEFGGESEGAS